MLKNFWKIAARQLLRNKSFSLLNIAGLAIGMATAILIIIWITHEASYDRFHPDQDRLYELMTNHTADGRMDTNTPTPEIMPAAIMKGCPEVQDVARIGWNDNILFNYKDKAIKSFGASADTGFLTMMNFPLLQGDARTALTDPYSIVLTETMSKKLFGSENAMGKIVKVDNSLNWTVTGVLKDLPDNTQFNFEWLNSYNWKTMKGYIDSDWTDVFIRAFVKLRPHTDMATVNARLKPMIRHYSNGRTNTEAFIYPLDRMRLYGEFTDGKPSGGRIRTVRIFGLIAGLILLIACINFMNLSTARSERRSREVGVRKVAGARRYTLILQFLCESLLMAAVAGGLALLIVQLSLPAFGELTGKKLIVDYGNWYFWVAWIAFIALTGLLAGSYPAFFLSSFKPALVLKGSFSKIGLLTPRKVLVVVQFTIAVVLIVSSVVIVRQIRYAQSRERGYDQRNLIYVQAEGNIYGHYPAVEAQLLQSGGVESVSIVGAPLTSTYSWGSSLSWEGMAPDTHIGFLRSATNGGIIKTAGLKLLAGRDIDVKVYPTDSTACLINESALKVMGIKDPIGQWIFDDPTKWHIVGVFSDFILQSPYQPIKPFIIKGPKSWHNSIHIKLSHEQSVSQDLAAIEKVFKAYNPTYPFEYHFIDAEYESKFNDEKLTARLAGIFAGLTILISCLGLFGLAAYLAESRTKEIGIRKVLGASVGRISLLLSSGFIRLVLISIGIAIPIAWWAMQQWLQSYSYRVPVQWWYFALAGVGAILIALIAVSSQAIRAARANPVRSLRSE